MTIETYPMDTKSPSGAHSRVEKSQISEGLIAFPYMAMELGAIFLLGLVIGHFYVAMTLGQPDYYRLYVTPLLLAPMIIGIMFHRRGYYEVANLRNPTQVALPIMKTTAASFTILILLGVLAGIISEYSRIWFFSWGFASIGVILLLRSLIAHLLSGLSNLEVKTKRTAIFGFGEAIQRANAKLTLEDSNTQIVGLFSDKPSSKTKDIKGNLQDLICFAQQTELDRIVIASDKIERKEIAALLDALSILPCEVDIHPDFLGDTAQISKIDTYNQSKMIRVQKKPISEWGLLIKAASDQVMALSGLLLLSPLLLLVAAAIKLESKGPIFFRQVRHGYNQREINVWKFRTMSVMENGDAFRQAKKNDARITRVGNILRKTSIDELPQLLNVLMGEMSIVGPRPHPIALNDDFSKRLLKYNNRHKVKPGITGWAQINGFRGPTDKPGQMDKRVEYDLDYIENWSFWFDMKIILATPYYGLVSKNAF